MASKETESAAHDDVYTRVYKDSVADLYAADGIDSYLRIFESTRTAPFFQGGNTKGYVKQLAFAKLLESAKRKNIPLNRITVLDAGCGQGELSVYLAAKGFNVIGVDLSAEACKTAECLADKVGVGSQCRFVAESLEKIPVPDRSVDFIIGFASFHHFIKYKCVANELHRILKTGGQSFFADSFGENKAYHIFHDKEKMKRLGDVILTSQLIQEFFDGTGKVELFPSDWFVMLDKLFLYFAPKAEKRARKISKLWFLLDRMIPNTRATLFLAGSVVTKVTKID
ncbi:class I SAM-dependent methyltransferase [Maridesulfovibrio hydrothermalis]|uniref:Methyltransferase type 11 domain-containing protein n=1 Tax=Maridesulfovibrio hydrothermalis AM13 = DSM 14728 TaxID=1121451 RepID=L0RFJ0_9BACT|nr:class I SAM-dependent methyltransferase [Maridesulfovibrio hydrothermalis]CCO24982.1 protein of unknown function [Maridesulfovibrio hydrothermalis AM13 = DSM 14728]